MFDSIDVGKVALFVPLKVAQPGEFGIRQKHARISGSDGATPDWLKPAHVLIDLKIGGIVKPQGWPIVRKNRRCEADDEDAREQDALHMSIVTRSTG